MSAHIAPVGRNGDSPIMAAYRDWKACADRIDGLEGADASSGLDDSQFNAVLQACQATAERIASMAPSTADDLLLQLIVATHTVPDLSAEGNPIGAKVLSEVGAYVDRLTGSS